MNGINCRWVYVCMCVCVCECVGGWCVWCCVVCCVCVCVCVCVASVCSVAVNEECGRKTNLWALASKRSIVTAIIGRISIIFLQKCVSNKRYCCSCLRS